MDFTPDSAQAQVQARARTFARGVLAPRADELDRVGGFPTENLARAAELGLLSINVPTELGGLGAGAVAYALAVMELAQGCAATTVATCVSNMVAEVVTAFGTPEQRATHVPRLCSGAYKVGGFALSEAGAGSDPGGMATRARRTDRGWVIDGSKLWITSGSDAGLFVVWARTNDAPGARGISAFLVRGDTPGLTRGKPEHKMGLNGSTTTALDFTECEVGPDALLGDEGRGFRVAMMALDGGRIGIASQAIGIGLAAVEVARKFASERRRYEDAQTILADAAISLDAARLMALRAAWLKQHEQPFSREAAMAKLFASERAFAACDRALQILGPDGYTRDFPVERHLRDVRVTMIYEGTSEIQRVVIGREIERRFSAGA